MNRKTLVLPAVVGLLAPVLAACGGSDGGSSGGDAIVVGTTDRFTASKDAPAPLDPAYAYDVGTWNILRQTVQTLMVQPARRRRARCPRRPRSCGFTDTGNERYALHAAQGPEVRQRRPRHRGGREVLHRPRPLHQGRQRCLRPAVHRRHRRDPGRPRGDLPPQDRGRHLPVQAVHPGRRHRQPDDYEKDKLRDGFEVDGSGPYTMEAEVKDDELVKAAFTKNPQLQGRSEGKNDKVEMSSFDGRRRMGDRPRKGDIDVMTRTHVAGADPEAGQRHRRRRRRWSRARPGDPLPGLQHRRPEP